MWQAGFLGAIELTSDSEDDKKISKRKKMPQTNKKRPLAAQTINLCSDEDIISKSPTKKNHYVIENDVIVILSSSDEEKPSSSKINPPEDRNVDHMDCGIDGPEPPEDQPSPMKSLRPSYVNSPNSATTVSSPFSAPSANIPPRVITFSDSQPHPTLQSQTSLYFSRTLASVQTSLSSRQRHGKSTQPNDRDNSYAEPAHCDPRRPTSSPPSSRSPSVHSKTRSEFQNLSILPDTLIPGSHNEFVVSTSKATFPDPIAKTPKPQPQPLFLPSSSPTPDVVIPDSTFSTENSDQRALTHFVSSSEDITVDEEPVLSATPSAMVTSTSDTVDKLDEALNNHYSVDAVPSTPSQMIDISAHSDIPGIDAIILTEALDDDLDGLELGYPEWST